MKMCCGAWWSTKAAARPASASRSTATRLGGMKTSRYPQCKNPEYQKYQMRHDHKQSGTPSLVAKFHDIRVRCDKQLFRIFWNDNGEFYSFQLLARRFQCTKLLLVSGDHRLTKCFVGFACSDRCNVAAPELNFNGRLPKYR